MTPNQTQATDEEVEELIQSLPKTTCMGTLQLLNLQGFWCNTNHQLLKSILNFQTNFNARDSDLIIASHPKTGTTWLKSLLFALTNRANTNQTPMSLSTHHPHELVYRLEMDIYGDAFLYPRPHHLDQLPSPRLFNTHLPYTSLPPSITTSNCKILYITRNPLDTIVSQWHFFPKAISKQLGAKFEPPCIEDYFQDFCEGRTPYGPFFDHVLPYWKQSLENPNKVLFFKYEELKDDPVLELKRLAEFVGLPFSAKEESEGVIKEIIGICDIKTLKEMDVNKSGNFNKFYEKKSYFRKGEIGDWTNYFSPDLAQKMSELMEEKLNDTGLSYKLLP